MMRTSHRIRQFLPSELAVVLPLRGSRTTTTTPGNPLALLQPWHHHRVLISPPHGVTSSIPMSNNRHKHTHTHRSSVMNILMTSMSMEMRMRMILPTSLASTAIIPLQRALHNTDIHLLLMMTKPTIIMVKKIMSMKTMKKLRVKSMTMDMTMDTIVDEVTRVYNTLQCTCRALRISSGLTEREKQTCFHLHCRRRLHHLHLGQRPSLILLGAHKTLAALIITPTRRGASA